ncbi:hypothetical protein M0Q97_04190 [Candidatus Dojkabacteria bacterium]|jgi:hypothetical protein|nr:hypothetical protein [Candidatus Dojkabacteria bacterium]
MNCKYGDTNTYKYKLKKEYLDALSTVINRSNSQTLFMYQLVDGDMTMFLELAYKMKKHFISYCPGDVDEVNKILNL